MWEDLDDTSLDEDDEEPNKFLIADTTSEGSELDQDNEVNFDDLKKKSKLCIEIETNASKKATLLKNFQELENKWKDLQKDLKELNELDNHQKKERYDLWRKCA
ncbi:hypothetical protein GmHk_05G012743 [Glycine max]|nr:hypothetical protein GmHk_05G012743 [Glycine max]